MYTSSFLKYDREGLEYKSSLLIEEVIPLPQLNRKDAEFGGVGRVGGVEAEW